MELFVKIISGWFSLTHIFPSKTSWDPISQVYRATAKRSLLFTIKLPEVSEVFGIHFIEVSGLIQENRGETKPEFLHIIKGFLKQRRTNRQALQQ